uniref:hypothetical protein n=1 Tax=Flavobacterium sp. TaxID=239 RepID=UPI0040499E3F
MNDSNIFKCLSGFAVLFFLFVSCNSDDEYQEIIDPVSPVTVDLAQVPYPKLSDYHFFDGEMKAMQPSLDVEPYLPVSELFTDYALKKRFLWMPENTAATYQSDGTILEFPVGTVLIKSFYYNNIQPNNDTKIMETRLMIRKASGWIFAEYVWNDDQTEAFLDMNGSYKDIEWKKDTGEIIPINYRIPSQTECLICHKSSDAPIPIGMKPQNLNFTYPYESGAKNQLTYLKEKGYLEASAPNPATSAINYKDVNQPLDLRVRSYLDINCAHCHQANSHCDYRPIRLAFSETASDSNLGICIPPDQTINSNLTNIITPRNIGRSVMYYRLNSNDEAYRMPLLGRSIIHEEGVQLFDDYINSLNQNCP